MTPGPKCGGPARSRSATTCSRSTSPSAPGPGTTRPSPSASAGWTTGGWSYLRELFGTFCPGEAEVEARSMLAFSLLIGNHFMAADHGPRSRADVLELAASWLLRLARPGTRRQPPPGGRSARSHRAALAPEHAVAAQPGAGQPVEQAAAAAGQVPPRLARGPAGRSGRSPAASRRPGPGRSGGLPSRPAAGKPRPAPPRAPASADATFPRRTCWDRRNAAPNAAARGPVRSCTRSDTSDRAASRSSRSDPSWPTAEPPAGPAASGHTPLSAGRHHRSATASRGTTPPTTAAPSSG